jgi:hypothetical protein
VFLSGVALAFDLSWRIRPAKIAGSLDILALFKLGSSPRQLVWAYTSSTEVPVSLCEAVGSRGLI